MITYIVFHLIGSAIVIGLMFASLYKLDYRIKDAPPIIIWMPLILSWFAFIVIAIFKISDKERVMIEDN